MTTYTYISTDTEEYNRGRAEGNADVAVELRKIVDPHDKLHPNYINIYDAFARA